MSVAYPSAGEMRIRRKGQDWVTIPLYSPLTVQQVTSFPAKVTQGEVNKGSHPLLSTWGFDGLTGGHGIAKHDGTTTRRYRIGLADTHNASYIAAPKKAVAIAGTSAAFMPHNDLVVSSTRRFYGSFGTDLYLFDESGDTMTDTTKNLSAAAVNPGVAFQGTGTLKLFIPCGTTGFATWDGTTLTNVAASGSKPAAKDFVQLGTLFICLDTSNVLWYTTDGSTWQKFSPSVGLDAGIVGNRLEIYKNGYGDKTVHIATDCGLFTFDPLGPTLYDTDLALPNHPYQGLGIRRWRDQLYISSGTGMFSWNGSAIDPMGLDRNHGLPEELVGTNGRITDVCSDLNYLYALIGAGFVDSYSIHAWTGEGWQMIWTGTADLLTTSKMVVSSAQSGYRLWWGYGNSAMTLPLNIPFANAEALAALNDTGYNHAWSLQTGMNAFEMDGYTKIAATVAWREYTADDGKLEFSYRTADDDAFITIPGYDFTPSTSTSTDGAWHDREYEFGFDAINARFYGEPVGQIEFQWRGDPTMVYTGPDIIKDFVCTFQKVVEGYRAWSTPMNLQRYYDHNQGDFAELINELVLANEYCDFQYQQEIVRVKFASWSGVDETGQAHHGGMRRLSIIEIPTSP